MTLKEKLFNAIFDNAWEFKTENVVPECEKIADDYASEILECYHNNLFFIQLKEGEAKEILKDIKKQKGWM